MLKKIDSIKQLWRLGLNTHDMVITNDLQEALDAADRFQSFTVRTDIDSSALIGWGDGTDLPFLIQRNPGEVLDKLPKLIDQGYWLIISDGVKYDPIQNYNAVASISREGDYRIELSTQKVPLRKMYNYPTFGAVGNLCDGLWGAEWFGTPCYDRATLLDDLLSVYAHGLHGRVLEYTSYPVPVGVCKESFVFWQIR